jgi:UDP-glucose 4-epimerase
MSRDALDHDVTDQTVLVTGGAGFVGSHIADALVGENDVRILDDLSSGRREHVPEGANLVVGDIRDSGILSAAMDGVDLVFHEAALVSVARSVEAPLETEATNVAATLRLLEAARREDARVVLASSAAVYGHPESVPVAEDHPTEPTSPYGVSKLAVDLYARRYATLHDLETVALRYFNIYGPRQRGGDYSGVITAFVEQALAGDPITVHGDGEQTRDFVHVRDVVRANLRAATTDHVGEAFNVGTGDRVTIAELAERIRDATGSSSPVVHADPREGDIRHSCADVERARRRLGFAATVPLSEGLSTVPGVPATDGTSPEP